MKGKGKGSVWINVVSIIIILDIISVHHLQQTNGCDVFAGRWVKDNSYPFYNTTSCPFSRKEFDCQRNGRPNNFYTKFRWQPHDCTLPRFDGAKLLGRLRGKSVMLVGDSMSRNQWDSLVCLLYSSVPGGAKVTTAVSGPVSTVTFTDYGVRLMYHRSVYLVDVVTDRSGRRILKLDSMSGARFWNGIDVISFNTWSWWNRRRSSSPWEYIEHRGRLFQDMDRVFAFQTALKTWAGWVKASVDPAKTKVFFLGISPSHSDGRAWNEANANMCVGQNMPVFGSSDNIVGRVGGGYSMALSAMERVVATLRRQRVQLLDITDLSLLRKDAHPSVYGLPGRIDCSHWCLPGLPDFWNQILFTFLLYQQ